MSSKHIPLGAQEHEILRAIARSAPAPAQIPLSSTQRLRFELLGLIEDRADGVRLTERGRVLAATPIDTTPSVREPAEHNAPRDRRGRRLGLRRRSPF